MERNALIILFILTTSLTFGQGYINEEYDCNLLNWKYQHIENPTELDSILVKVECLVIRNRFSKAMEILDSLISTDETNLGLYLERFRHKSVRGICDTVYLGELNTASNLVTTRGTELFNLAVFHFNFLVACNDSTNQIAVSTTEKLSILQNAERIVKRSAQVDETLMGESYEFLVKSQVLRAEITKEPLPEFSLVEKFDTLLLMAQLMDCGEFGGHMEYIECYYSEGRLVCRFWQNDPICQGYFQSKEDTNSFKTTEQSVSYKALSEYVQYLTSIDKSPATITNAPTSFWVVKDEQPFFIRDWTGDSGVYKDFRDEVFKE